MYDSDWKHHLRQEIQKLVSDDEILADAAYEDLFILLRDPSARTENEYAIPVLLAKLDPSVADSGRAAIANLLVLLADENEDAQRLLHKKRAALRNLLRKTTDSAAEVRSALQRLVDQLGPTTGGLKDWNSRLQDCDSEPRQLAFLLASPFCPELVHFFEREDLAYKKTAAAIAIVRDADGRAQNADALEWVWNALAREIPLRQYVLRLRNEAFLTLLSPSFDRNDLASCALTRLDIAYRVPQYGLLEFLLVLCSGHTPRRVSGAPDLVWVRDQVKLSPELEVQLIISLQNYCQGVFCGDQAGWFPSSRFEAAGLPGDVGEFLAMVL